MKGTEILNRAAIFDVWRALGGGPLRHWRGRVFWRNGDSDNVVLDDDRGVWYDHAHGAGRNPGFDPDGSRLRPPGRPALACGSSGGVR